MQDLIKILTQASTKEFEFHALGNLLSQVDFTKVAYKKYIPQAESSRNYSRNILMLDPIEVVVLNWPPGVESAIHHHEGFWGYVAVLEGSCENIEYKYHNKQLSEQTRMIGKKGGLIPEKDGVIHLLRNPSKTQRAITCHIYYPPLKDFNGMELFDIENNRRGILNVHAQTSSWEEPKAHFSEIEENAFQFKSFSDSHKSSHRVLPILPKPAPEQVSKMISAYYNEQAHMYDHFDTQHKSRSAYTKAINDLIAEGLQGLKPLHKVINLACGTGRRVKDIQKLSGKNYALTGVDISTEMCKQARKKGILAIEGDWLTAEINEQFDAATFLYAFGHLVNREQRLMALKKVHTILRPGGVFYFDVFNRDDETEWGPRATHLYNNYHLSLAGYEKGDVFYQKVGGKEVAFLHYFTRNEIETLLLESGFSINDIVSVGYTKNAGEVNKDFTTGCIFVKAVKT